jgi:hypothetical protein
MLTGSIHDLYLHHAVKVLLIRIGTVSFSIIIVSGLGEVHPLFGQLDTFVWI